MIAYTVHTCIKLKTSGQDTHLKERTITPKQGENTKTVYLCCTKIQMQAVLILLHSLITLLR